MTLLSQRSPLVSFSFLDIVMELRNKKRYSFKDALKGKHPTKRQSQVKEDIPNCICIIAYHTFRQESEERKKTISRG